MKTILTLRIFFFFLILGSGMNSFALGSGDNPCPVATISFDGSPYCSNAGQAVATVFGERGGTFSSTPGLVINPVFGVVDLASSSPGTYTVVYTLTVVDSGCVPFTTTADITINAAPSVTFNYAGSPYCTGAGTASVSLNGTIGGTFSSDQQVTIDPNSGDIDLSNTSSGTHIITYTIPASGGCDVYSVSTTLTINATPNASISYSNPSYCKGAPNAAVNLSGDNGGVFSSTPGLTIDPNTGEINCQASTPGTYQVNYDLSNNCGSFTASTTVTIESGPVATLSYDNSPYCIGTGGTAIVNFVGTSGGTFSSTAGLTIDANTGNIDLGSSTPGNYAVSYYLNTGDCSVTANTTVTITTQPSATIQYPNLSYCILPSTAAYAEANINGTQGGTFSADPGLVINSTTGAVDLTASIPGTYTVTYYIAATAGSCGDFTTTTGITLVETPKATIWYQNSPYCSSGDTAMVSLIGTEGGTFTSTSGLVIDASTGTIDIQSSTPGDYVVTYTVGGAPCGPFSTTTDISLDGTCHVHQFPFSFNEIRAARTHNTIAVNWLVSNQNNISSYVIERSNDGLNFSVVGNQSGNSFKGIGVAYTWTDLNPGSGDNYYRIRSISTQGKTVVSSTVKANNSKDGSLVDIYPNPVVGHVINIQLKGMEGGTYGLKLINDNGVQVQFNQIVFKGGNAVHNIKLGNTITKGFYHLEIVHPDGTRTTEPVVILE